MALISLFLILCASCGESKEEKEAKAREDFKMQQSELLIKAKNKETIIMDSILIVDPMLKSVQSEMDSLKNFFMAVPEERLPGYIIDKSQDKVRITDGNIVRPMLGDALSPWSLEVSIKGNKDISGLSFQNNGKTININPNNVSARRVKGDKYEIFNFTSNEATPLAQTLNGTIENNLTLTVRGEKGDTDIVLTPATQKAIWRIYRYAVLRDQYKELALERELLERKLMLAKELVEKYSQK